MKTFERILVATDFSAASRPAVALAVRLAQVTGAQLTVANAYEPPGPIVMGGYCVPSGVYEDWEIALREGIEESLKPLVEDAVKKGVDARALVLTGIPDVAIAQAARTIHADLLVVGTHGRTGLSRLLLGSVAERVIAAAPCPVMTCTDEPSENREERVPASTGDSAPPGRSSLAN